MPYRWAKLGFGIGDWTEWFSERKGGELVVGRDYTRREVSKARSGGGISIALRVLQVLSD